MYKIDIMKRTQGHGHSTRLRRTNRTLASGSGPKQVSGAKRRSNGPRAGEKIQSPTQRPRRLLRQDTILDYIPSNSTLSIENIDARITQCIAPLSSTSRYEALIPLAKEISSLERKNQAQLIFHLLKKKLEGDESYVKFHAPCKLLPPVTALLQLFFKSQLITPKTFKLTETGRELKALVLEKVSSETENKELLLEVTTQYFDQMIIAARKKRQRMNVIQEANKAFGSNECDTTEPIDYSDGSTEPLPKSAYPQASLMPEGTSDDDDDAEEGSDE